MPVCKDGQHRQIFIILSEIKLYCNGLNLNIKVKSILNQSRFWAQKNLKHWGFLEHFRNNYEFHSIT